ncbi:hypothetical protein P5673_020900, partial [Acropora cervicornis]
RKLFNAFRSVLNQRGNLCLSDEGRNLQGTPTPPPPSLLHHSSTLTPLPIKPHSSSPEKRLGIAADEWKIKFRELHEATYTALCKSLLRIGKVDEALFAAEQGRAQTLSDNLLIQYNLPAFLPPIDTKETISRLFTKLSTPAIFLAIEGLTINISFLKRGKKIAFRQGSLEGDRRDKDPIRVSLETVFKSIEAEVNSLLYLWIALGNKPVSLKTGCFLSIVERTASVNRASDHVGLEICARKFEEHTRMLIAISQSQNSSLRDLFEVLEVSLDMLLRKTSDILNASRIRPKENPPLAFLTSTGGRRAYIITKEMIEQLPSFLFDTDGWYCVTKIKLTRENQLLDIQGQSEAEKSGEESDDNITSYQKPPTKPSQHKEQMRTGIKRKAGDEIPATTEAKNEDGRIHQKTK